MKNCARLFARLVLPLLLLLSGAVPALAQASGWSISEAKGVVVVTDAQGQRAAKPGTVLAAGATIRTEARASAVLVRGREFVTMRQNAQLRIPAPAQARERGLIQIIQDYGSALFNIGKQKNPHFGVETPYLAAVVKGTTFVITVTGEGASLQVTEGAVEAATNDGGVRELIRPGAVAMIAAGDPLRMVIEGEGRRVLDSPARPAAGPAAAAPASAPASAASPASAPAPASASAPLEPAAASGRGEGRIQQAIVSTPGNAGDFSRGFVSGEVSVMAAVVVADNTSRGSAPAFSNSGGRSGDDAVCAGASCAGGGDKGGSNDNGNDNGNGGGDDDGGNPGNGNGNGGGDDDGGNPGNGNGNGGGDDDGGDPGNGNGNGGGDDDGGDPGNGNGNGGGDDDGGNPGNGNGNGGGDDDGGDPGNGNGNGGGNDDGGNGNGGGGGIRIRIRLGGGESGLGASLGLTAEAAPEAALARP